MSRLVFGGKMRISIVQFAVSAVAECFLVMEVDRTGRVSSIRESYHKQISWGMRTGGENQFIRVISHARAGSTAGKI